MRHFSTQLSLQDKIHTWDGPKPIPFSMLNCVLLKNNFFLMRLKSEALNAKST